MTDKQLSKSSASLAAADLSASADNALAALGHAGENASALVEAWVKAGNAAAVNVASEGATGAARKAARRGLNVLKARGIAIPDREPRRQRHWRKIPGNRRSADARPR